MIDSDQGQVLNRSFPNRWKIGAIAQLGERVVRNDEVGGSIPPGSTSAKTATIILRATLSPGEGCHAGALAKADETMRYVYILQSENDPDRHYTGVTDDIAKRLNKHNAQQGAGF